MFSRIPKHLEPFWDTDGLGYTVMGHYHDHTDWKVMRDAIAARLAERGSNGPLRILDVGCGKGWNTQDIADTVFALTRQRPIVDIVEPGQSAITDAVGLLGPIQKGGFLRRAFNDIRQIETGRYDAVMFMHSAYYIAQFDGVLEKLADKHLAPHGEILVHTLPSDSPFFLGSCSLPNQTGEVEETASTLGFHVQKQQYRSRFMLDAFKRFAGEDGVTIVKNFMDAPHMPSRAFLSRLAENADGHGDVDLRDDMLWLSRRDGLVSPGIRYG